MLEMRSNRCGSLLPKNVFKTNIDGAISIKDQMTGLEATIKDSNDKMVVVGIRKTQLRRNVGYVEAEVIEWGLQVAKEVSSLIIETDCQEVTDFLDDFINPKLKKDF